MAVSLNQVSFPEEFGVCLAPAPVSKELLMSVGLVGSVFFAVMNKVAIQSRFNSISQEFSYARNSALEVPIAPNAVRLISGLAACWGLGNSAINSEDGLDIDKETIHGVADVFYNTLNNALSLFFAAGCTIGLFKPRYPLN